MDAVWVSGGEGGKVSRVCILVCGVGTLSFLWFHALETNPSWIHKQGDWPMLFGPIRLTLWNAGHKAHPFAAFVALAAL